MGGIQASIDDLAREASSQPNSTSPHGFALNFCLLNPAFTMDHLRNSGARSAAAIPGPAKTQVTSIVISLLRQEVTIRGDILRTDVWSLVLIFPTLVFGPHRPGAHSSAVKVETEARISLWQHLLTTHLLIIHMFEPLCVLIDIVQVVELRRHMVSD